ncbi:MAG: methionyl-tRNA formyltransferase [Pseudomonadota bacterium]
MSLRIVFMGTPDFSVPVLQALHAAGHEIVCVYSQPPRPAGRRGLELKPSPVQVAAEELVIEVRTPTRLKSAEEQDAFAALNADVAVVVAYGLLLPKAVLEAPKHGCYNGHASLLPRWRGAAPIQRAIMAGDDETGMMIMKMDVGLDTGPVALTARTPIDHTTTAGALHDTLSEMGADLMVEAMALLGAGNLQLTPQSEQGITYARKIEKAEARIDWSQPAPKVQRMIMGLSPFPGAWCDLPLGGKTVRTKVLSAKVAEASGPAGEVLDDRLTIACHEGSVVPTLLQKAGAKPMALDAFLAGNAVPAGTLLTSA